MGVRNTRILCIPGTFQLSPYYQDRKSSQADINVKWGFDLQFFPSPFLSTVYYTVVYSTVVTDTSTYCKEIRRTPCQ